MFFENSRILGLDCENHVNYTLPRIEELIALDKSIGPSDCIKIISHFILPYFSFMNEDWETIINTLC
jgi:hypothetical protein